MYQSCNEPVQGPPTPHLTLELIPMTTANTDLHILTSAFVTSCLECKICVSECHTVVVNTQQCWHDMSLFFQTFRYLTGVDVGKKIC